MLTHAYWRPLTILASIGAVLASTAYSARGQDLRIAQSFGSASLGDFYASMAQPADEESGAQPDAVAPAAKKPPLSAEATSPPVRQPSPRRSRTSTAASRSPLIRLGGLPNMFGDVPTEQIQVGPSESWGDYWDPSEGNGIVDIPSPGGARSVKIAENDKALPMDRVFFMYNHFQNALDGSIDGLGARAFPVDQYTIGVEKTFFDQLWSVELRLPFSRTPQVTGTDLAIDTGDVGNLAIVLKRLLFVTETTAVGVGLPIGTPTGSDVTGQALASSFSLSNDAVHLAPFVGFAHAPNDRVFSQGFLQIDVATQGNRIIYGGNDLGRLHEQTLLYLDYSMGYWLYRNPSAPYLTGLAAVVEYHYTTTLQNADLVGGTDGSQFLQFGNAYNRQDISNLTIGLHTELGLTTVRVGGAFPLGGNSNRLYDAEVQFSVNRRF